MKLTLTMNCDQTVQNMFVKKKYANLQASPSVINKFHAIPLDRLGGDRKTWKGAERRPQSQLKTVYPPYNLQLTRGYKK